MTYAPQGFQSDPFSINGLFLKHYLDLKIELVKTFETQNLKAFNLHVLNLRASVMGTKRRAAIDAAQQEMLARFAEEDETGVETSKDMREWQLGMCVVEACSEFLNDAFHITQSDGAAMLDMTDDELALELNRYNLMVKAFVNYKGDYPKIKETLHKISDMSIKNEAELNAYVPTGEDIIEDSPEGAAE